MDIFGPNAMLKWGTQSDKKFKCYFCKGFQNF